MTDGPDPDPYRQRIDRVIAHICAHLGDDLSLEQLSGVAGLSKFHFHRLFKAYSGFTVAQYVRLVRLRRAAYQLAFDPRRTILDIALDAGFSAPESFTRAFKDAQGQTPTDFRRAPHWGAAASGGVKPPTPTRTNAMHPQIVEFEATRIAALEHHGPRERLMATVGRFIEWRKSCQDSPNATSRTFGIIYHDAESTTPEEFRFDVCGELRGPLQPNTAGVKEKLIPGGRCAVARHLGSTDALPSTVRALYESWLPQSGERVRDFPVFFHYIQRMPSVAEHEQVTDVYLPLSSPNEH